MSTKRRFSKYRLLRKNYRFMQMLGEQTKTTSVVAGKWKRPICKRCGKKIRNIEKLVYIDGAAYHKTCIGGEENAGEDSTERRNEIDALHNVQALATDQRDQRDVLKGKQTLHEHE